MGCEERGNGCHEEGSLIGCEKDEEVYCISRPSPGLLVGPA
jgi:hypothetical protein